MNQTDIEAYAREKLKEYTLIPDETIWVKLSEKLQESELKRKRSSSYGKMASLLVALFLGSISLRDSERATSVIMADKDNGNVEKTKSEASQISIIEPFTFKNEEKITKTKSAQSVTQHVATTEMELKTNSSKTSSYESWTVREEAQISTSVSESSTPKKRTVTQEEIEMLIKEARQNRQMELMTLNVRKAMAYELLAEVERDIERPRHAKLYQDLKRGFMKIKTVVKN